VPTLVVHTFPPLLPNRFSSSFVTRRDLITEKQALAVHHYPRSILGSKCKFACGLDLSVGLCDKMDHIAHAVRLAKSVLGSKRTATAITSYEEFVAVTAVIHGLPNSI